MSDVPPAAYGMMTRIGCVGAHGSAAAAGKAKNASASSGTKRADCREASGLWASDLLATDRAAKIQWRNDLRAEAPIANDPIADGRMEDDLIDGSLG
jgi:hypothetical protein